MQMLNFHHKPGKPNPIKHGNPRLVREELEREKEGKIDITLPEAQQRSHRKKNKERPRCDGC